MMNGTQFKSPFFRKFGYVVWLAMLVLALIFYKERAFFMDGGFQLFNLINEETIQIYHYRFVTGLPQVLPWILLKTGAPLKALAMSFSAAYILFYLLVYHLLVRYLKNDFLGWTLIFLFTLISLDTFYHIQSEFYLGLSLLLLAFGIVLRYPDMRERWLFPVLLPLLVTVGFSHKLTVVFFLFLWLFSGLNNKALRHRRYLFFLGLMLAASAVKSIWFTNWYEAAKQADFQNNLNQYFPNLHTIPANFIFLKRCLHHYYMLPVLLLAVSAFYVFQKKNRGINWLKLLMIWGFPAGFLLLYNISDPQAPYRFYSEVTYLPLILFAAVPFLFDVVPSLEKKEWKFFGKMPVLPALFAAVILLRLGTITLNSRTFDNQYDWITGKLEKAEALGTNRLLIKSEDVPADTVLMEWGVPFTATLLTSLENPADAKTLLVLPDFERYKTESGRDDYFLSPFKAIEVEKLNRRYFDFGRGKYQLIGR